MPLKEKSIKIPLANMGDNGMFLLNGFGLEKIHGQKILKNMYHAKPHVSEASTDFSGLLNFAGIMKGMTTIDLGQAFNDIVGIAKSKLFGINTAKTNSLGLMNTIPTSGASTDKIIGCNGGDVLANISEHLLYTSANHLGRGFRGTATGGSTETIIDTGTNFVDDAGMSTDTGSNKVMNIDTGKVLTITSITQTTNANDTLNFAASTATSVGDVYVCFKDDFKKFDTTADVGDHFTGQTGSGNWMRQIKQWEDDYYILNGNYIAKLDNDESTFSATDKQLPERCQTTCMDINQSRMLVGGKLREKGKLLLRDTFSPGWLSIIDLERQPLSIKAYASGWLVTLGTGVYYTDGYTLKLMAQVPFDYGSFNWTHGFNGMAIVDEKIYLVKSGAVTYPRGRTGIYIYDLNMGGWSYSSLGIDTVGTSNVMITSEYATVGMIFATSNVTTPIFYVPHTTPSATNTDNICKLSLSGGYRVSVIGYVKLPHKMKVGTVELNLMPRIDKSDNISSDLSVVVQVNYGQGKKRFGLSTTFGASSTTILLKNTSGATLPCKVGQELLVIDSDLAGERTFITSVVNDGTATEECTLDPPLTTTPTESSTIMKLDLYSAGKRRNK